MEIVCGRPPGYAMHSATLTLTLTLQRFDFWAVQENRANAHETRKSL